MQCPTESTLADFVEERLPKDEERAIGEHMDACPECRATVALTTRSLFAERKNEVQLDAPPTTVSHYAVLNVLGAGAMGIVYAAHDPRLDRKVALKILPEQEPLPDLAATAKRLLREAQAMAKLSHPNVVTVYDVGTVGERLFLAMEFVDGMTLSEWLRVEKRPAREIVDVFLQAGEGLAAAHAAGIVHRDFKPDNVLVGFDGQVKVTDFGLARSVAGTGSVEKPAIGGTPAYMAPEQARGEAADARSDQYSFAVSLFEALEGGRPSAVTPSARQAPARIHDVLARSLSADPHDRYPAMPASAVEKLGLAVAIDEKALGPNYLRAVFPLVTRSQVLLAAEHDDEAFASMEQAQRIQHEAGKKARPDVQVELEICYSVYWRRHGQAAKALEHASSALATAEKTYGHQSGLTTAMAHAELARVALACRSFKDGLAQAREALAIMERQPTQMPLRLEEVLLAVGEALYAQGTAGEAIVPLERARTIAESHKTDGFKLADVEYTLAKALWDSNTDRPRARTLAQTASDAYAKDPLMATKRAEVTRWLASH